MELLHVIGEFDVKAGGTYTALLSIVKLLNELGHRNSIITTRKEKLQLENPIQEANLISFEQSFPKRFRKSRKAVNWLEGNIEKFDIVIIHEIWGGIGLDASLLAMKKKVRYHIWPHGSLDPFDLQKKKYLKIILGKLFVNKLLSNAEYICCTAKKEKELLNCFGVVKNNILLLPLPVDFCVVKEVIIPKPSLIRKDLSDDAFIFLFFSRINYKKGLDLFLQAFSQCLEGKMININSYLVIAGAGTEDYENYINDLISKLKLEDRIIKLGLVTGGDRLTVYANAHVFILPSRNENFGLSVIEALQTGTPVLISNNIYIHDELFSFDKPGWVCEYEINDLKNKIIESAKVNVQDRITAKRVGQRFFTSNLLQAYEKVFN